MKLVLGNLVDKFYASKAFFKTLLLTKYITSGPQGFREDLKNLCQTFVSQFRVKMFANVFSYNGVHLKAMIWLTLLAASYMLKNVCIVKITTMGDNFAPLCHVPFEINKSRDWLVLFDSLRPINNLSVKQGWVFLG